MTERKVDPREVFFKAPGSDTDMDFQEAKEIIRAGIAWANWTDKQKAAMELACRAMDELEEIKDIERIHSQKETIEMANHYNHLIPWIENYFNELQKDSRSTKNHLVARPFLNKLKNKEYLPDKE